MSFPLRFALANTLLGPRGEAGALYRIEPISYPYLPGHEKVRWLWQLAALVDILETDLSIYRVSRAYPAEEYLPRVEGLVDERFADARAWRAYLAGHTDHIADLRVHLPEVYLVVSLRGEHEGGPRPLVDELDRVRRRVEALFGVAASEPIRQSELERLAATEAQVFDQVSSILRPAEVRRAEPHELEWLLRRAGCRGVREPELDPAWRPDARLLRSREGSELRYEPLESDLVRCAGAAVFEEDRALVVDDAECRSYQAMLCLESLPEEARFPGPRAELLSAPLEWLGFSVDAVLHARYVTNKDAVGQVRKRVLDADAIFDDESSSHRGATLRSDENRRLARELEQALQSEERPPLLDATISFAVGAETREELERRVERVRDSFRNMRVTVRRPFGLQADLYLDHLPRADAGRVREYREMLLVEQFGGLMPIASHFAGDREGVYLGRTTGNRPVGFDPLAAAASDRPPSILMAGTLGSGKTIAAQLLCYQAAKRGSLVVDVDPKPDHALAELPDLAERSEVIELSQEQARRGLLDPLRVAPEALRADLASAYLMDVLPRGPASQAWEAHVRRAVREVHAEGGGTLAVVARLRASEHRPAQEAALALEGYAEEGLGALAFGEAQAMADSELERDVTSIRADVLSLPAAGTARESWSADERLSVATLKLVASYAMRLTRDPDRHAMVLIDEAWMLLASQEGRRLLDRLLRLGRSQNTTLILATQSLADVAGATDLIGTFFMFGQRSEAEARRALELVGLDPSDGSLAAQVRGYERGLCLMRDVRGHIAEVQIDLVYPELLERLDTSPRRPGRAEEELAA